jgi:TRAP-type C4-dicarboxylate transport system permease small subunit
VSRLERALYQVMRGVTLLAFVALLVLLAGVVFIRFVPFMSSGWSDELIELAFAWVVFLGAAVLWRDRGHFRVDMVPGMLAGGAAGRALEISLDVLALAFLAVFTYQSGMLTYRATDTTPVFVLPKALWYGVMPLAGAIMVAYTARDLVARLRGRPPRASRSATAERRPLP